ncbi:hypothetical protein ACRALDRAFT_1052581 [Sodiomyces alcalophilus JCM 7366]|uniref:uncharacterized protein n=1 Tax=Sodiomyces alcalophilus JCM 7366 TaxID=591952 RepID=UPI0039B41E9E
MAPTRSSGGDVTLHDALDSISGGTVKERSNGLDDLIFLLEKKARAANLSGLGDKHYHRIFETLFRCAVTEKQSYYGGKKTTAASAATRLSKCAEALRLALNHGAAKLKRKTVFSVIDHVTQTLPGRGPDQHFVEPLLQDYIKSMVVMLSHQANVEHLGTHGGEGWTECVEFCIDAMLIYLDGADQRDSSSRASPAPGTGMSSCSLPASGRSVANRRGPGQLHRGTLQDLLQCLYLLVVPPNAPLAHKSQDIATTLLRALQLRHSGLSQITYLAFASLNVLLANIQADDIAQTRTLAKEIVPLITHWWQGRAVSKDEMLNSVRDEMLKTMFFIHLHLERIVLDNIDDSIEGDLEDLSEALWLEYTRRNERDQLQLDDITFLVATLPGDYFSLSTFGLRPHNQEGERKWALVQNLAFLERILSVAKSHKPLVTTGLEEQPRKKRRTAVSASRLLEKLKSADPAVQRTAIQLIPYLLEIKTYSPSDLEELRSELSPTVSGTGSTASWAMLACASYIVQSPNQQHNTSVWKPIWQIAARAASLLSTCRAACHLMHVIIESDVLPYHSISDEINSLVATADVNGPATLVDSSITLMMRLLYLRNTKLPSASQSTSHHIIRWTFFRWNPVDLTFASSKAIHTHPCELADLIQACCGVVTPQRIVQTQVSGGPISQAWAVYNETAPVTRYLLLLENPAPKREDSTKSREDSSVANLAQTNVADSSHTSKRLLLELFGPKIEELQELCNSWSENRFEARVQVSPERLHSLFSACVVGALLMPQLQGLNSRQSRDIESAVFGLLDSSLGAALDAPDNQPFFDVLLKASSLHIPPLETTAMNLLVKEGLHILRLLFKVAECLHQRTLRESSGQHQDFMDLDDEFESQASRASISSRSLDVPRRSQSMKLSHDAFCMSTTLRLYFLEAIHKDHGQAGLIPGDFLEHALSLSKEDLLLSKDVLSEVFKSDLIVNPDDALHIIEKLGEVIGAAEFTCCEVAHSMTLDVMEGLVSVWLDDKHEVAACVGDLYHYFIKASLPKNSLSPRSQIRLAELLFSLLRHDPQYGTKLGLSSCRTTLLSILQPGAMLVKHYIATRLPDIFGLYVLKTHDDVFIDILDSLPTDAGDVEGIAFRLFALSELACRWSTLLRRCTYHIFETPANIPSSTKYATRCVAKVSEALGFESPKQLFEIFQPQLLYTWLDGDEVDRLPFEIFGYSSLYDMLQASKAEATALMFMRGQDQRALDLAQKLNTNVEDLIKHGFGKTIAYAIAHDTNTSRSGDSSAETSIRKRLGKEPYLDSIYAHFADIVALFFDLFDQEDPLEKYFAKDQNFAYAATNMGEMKQHSHSPVVLPGNQQPMFKAKYLLRQLFHLCSRTEYELHSIWTPALVVHVARRLLNTVHPALGSLHACSVLRKVRVLIALAGPVALELYPLEMLLHSIRPFIVDSECADDALGVSQYLITRGSKHLEQVPSFLAGYALSTLASLRVFLESSQSSTTQESQFKATMSKAQQFHGWFSRYLSRYEFPEFMNEGQRSSFRTITQAASHIRSSGNAESGTHESTLLLEILRDGKRENKLLNEGARDLALGMLCGDFVVPSSVRLDVIDDDQKALQHSGPVWKSCKAHALSDEYLAWAGRVVGRSFAASGELPLDLLRESDLAKYVKLASGANGSEQGLLTLLQRLTVNKTSFTAGLAESSLRLAVSEAAGQENQSLLIAAQKTLHEPLYLASEWHPYRTPPSDGVFFTPSVRLSDAQLFSREHIEQPEWAQNLAIHLSQAAPDSIILNSLLPVLTHVKGFAEEAFPFILHLALYSQLDKQQTVKRHLSEAMKGWFNNHNEACRTNQKHLINALLYLRTQPLPNESSIADRTTWMDVDFLSASSAASRCGMHKTAILFIELAASKTTRTSRRSSASREADSSDVLLTVFENIDDPDAYYGLSQASNLSTVLARLEYENDGPKSLAFRGAQYDSHVRRRDPAAHSDGLSLVKALSTLGLSGLSHSVLQTQQSLDENTDSINDMFHTARRLEIWNLPVPGSNRSHAVTMYKAFQSIQQAHDMADVRHAIHDGLYSTMRSATTHALNAAALRHHLGALAALTELDDVINVSDMNDLENMLHQFDSRGQWMRRGRYDDVSQLLSCRETTMSLLSQQGKLRATANLTTAQARQTEIRCLLLSSGIYRFHRATQESLNLSTALTDLINPCHELGLNVDAAIRVESANSLWDHGEMISSIRMLQNIDNDVDFKKQSIHLSRSDLLSRIAHQVSVARLEKPHDIQKNYLEPALKELKGKSEGKEAGKVFHQFAVFCDEQLQNQDSLEDLARLQGLRKGKSDEVSQLKALISSTRDTQMRSRYSSHLARAQQWLQLDEQELRRVVQTRGEFVRLSLENYLLSLIASDEHNNDALRFTALWLERSDDDAINDVVRKHLDKVPTRKFATLMNQLSSRLQDQSTPFQRLLMNLVYNICVEHPYHGMYQIWSGTKVKANSKDEVAVLRQKATERVARQLERDASVGAIWYAIDRTSGYYHRLAVDRDPSRYKSGQKIALRETGTGSQLVSALNKYQIPPPTMQLELAADRDYSRVPVIAKLEPYMSIASGVSAPKIITAVGSDGQRYKQLVKGGNDDLRQDAIMEQVFAAVSSLLKLHRETQQRNLGIRTYKVLPLTSASGLIEFVPNTIPLHEFLMPAHERYFPNDLRGSQCRKEISNAQGKSVEVRISTYRKVKERFHPVMRYFFMEYFADPDEWFMKRTAYTRTTAAISMLGHVLGLGDRHGHNILLDHKTGEVVHIDLGVAFEMGRVLPVPELVPFRLTRDIEDGMGITKTEGVFRRCCEFTLHALREETYSIMTILDVLRYDPLYSWSISPVRLAKLQDARAGGSVAGGGGGDGDNGAQSDDTETGKGRKGPGARVNEPSEADRALEVVRKKLSKTLSVTATVNDLINQATDERNLAVLYSGWAAYA